MILEGKKILCLISEEIQYCMVSFVLCYRFVSFSSDDTTSSHLFGLILNEAVRRRTREEVKTYRQSFIALIEALCQKEIYSYELIQSLFGRIDKPLYPEGLCFNNILYIPY